MESMLPKIIKIIITIIIAILVFFFYLKVQFPHMNRKQPCV